MNKILNTKNIFTNNVRHQDFSLKMKDLLKINLII